MVALASWFGLSDQAFTAIAAAFVTGMFGVIGVVIQRDNARTRAENQEQHAQGRTTLLELVGKVDVVHDDVKGLRDDVTKLTGDYAVHEHRLDQHDATLDGLKPKPTVVDWNGPYDDEGAA